MSKLRILLFDIENLMKPQHIFNSGKPSRFASRPAGFCADLAYILVFGYKWLGSKKAEYIIANKKDFKNSPTSDESILYKIYDIMNEADVVVTWYGSVHDFRFVTARLAQKGMYLDQRIKHIDLHKTAKTVLPLSSNRLNKVAEFFGKELKTDISPEIWARTWAGDYDALKEMAEYCAQDVEVLEQVYQALKPLEQNMPHVRKYVSPDGVISCPMCESANIHSKGRRVTKIYTIRRLHCQECGGWFDGEKTKRV